jgi:hypothetical protein
MLRIFKIFALKNQTCRSNYCLKYVKYSIFMCQSCHFKQLKDLRHLDKLAN